MAKLVVEEFFGGGHPDRTVLTLPLRSENTLGTSLGTSFDINVEADSELAKRRLLLEFCQEPRSKKEIQEYLNIASERYVRQVLIYLLLESGELCRTIPDKPKSPKQRYIRGITCQ